MRYYCLYIITRGADFLRKSSHFFTNMIPYQQIDPYDIFASISIHHAVQMIIAIVIIVVLSRLLKIDFYLQLGA